ncbi:hypothetical protein V9T40_014270 [Parthenolecanium corni]|uniref:Spondin domain-containing protein n=1 Tax=Parthenolecanium corni TaxID=536013 RepID=A0AAN9XX73_9HEMI
MRHSRSHGKSYVLFRVGKKSSAGMKTFAESGKDDLLNENGQGEKDVFDVFTAPAIPTGSGRTETQFVVDGNHSLVSLASRIVPSPDWFIGIDSFNLCVNGNWLDSITVEADPMDAGIDNGFTFTAPNWPTQPQGVVFRMSSKYPSHPAGSFYYPQLKRLPPIATFQFIKIRAYDLSEVFYRTEDEKKYDVFKITDHEKEENLSPLSNEVDQEIEGQRLEQEILLKNELSKNGTFELHLLTTPKTETSSREAESNLLSLNDIDHYSQSRRHDTYKRKKKKYSRDCKISEWGAWSNCSAVCGVGEMIRKREILKHPKGKGLSCPPLVETKWCKRLNLVTKELNAINSTEEISKLYHEPRIGTRKPLPCLVLDQFDSVTGNEDLALKLVRDKYVWKRRKQQMLDLIRRKYKNKGKGPCQINKIVPKNTNGVTKVPYGVSRLADHLSKNPDKSFSGLYNWYFDNALSTMQFADQPYLMHAGGEKLNKLCFSAIDSDETSSSIPVVTTKFSIPLEEEGPIFHIFSSQMKDRIGIRQRNSCKVFVLNTDSDVSDIARKSYSIGCGNYPFVSADIASKEICTVDANRVMKLWNVSKKKCISQASLPQSDSFLSDKFVRVEFSENCDFITAIDRKNVYSFDTRSKLTNPVAHWSCENYVEMCEEMSLMISSATDDNFFIGTTHSCLLLDMRSGFVQKWSHMLPQTPTVGHITSVAYESGESEELLILCSQGCSDVVAICNNTSSESSITCSPFSLPNRTDTLHEARSHGVLYQPVLQDKFDFSVIGLTSYDVSEHPTLFSLISSGDIFQQKLVLKTPDSSKLSKKEISYLENWENKSIKLFSSRKKPRLVITHTVGMENLFSTLEDVEIPEWTTKPANLEKIKRFTKKELESYTDLLAPCLLNDYGVLNDSDWEDEEDIMTNLSEKSFNIVQNWLQDGNNTQSARETGVGYDSDEFSLDDVQNSEKTNTDADDVSILSKYYIQENKHKSFIDAGALVDYLRQKYPEYLRRQKAAVKYLAGQVFAKLMAEEKQDSNAEENMSVEPIASDSEDRSNLSSISSEDEMTPANISLPNINDTILEMYKTAHSSTSQDDEFINISSDENIEENHSSSGSTITIDDDQQIKPADDPSSLAKKRKHCDQPDPTETSSTDKICKTNGDIAAPDSKNSTPVCKKPKNRTSTTGTKNNITEIKNNDLNSSKARKSIAFEDSLAASNVPSITLADVAGCQNVIMEVVRLMMHIYHPEIYHHIGIDPPRGFLLHGPPGCGKTLLANAVAGELKIPLIDIAAPELVAGVSGISEQRIRKLFESAIKLSPCVLFIDEIDCITQNRDVANKDMERRIVSQLLSSLDRLSKDPKGSQILVIGATNRPDNLDPALRRAGRFDREVCMGIPDKESRYDILRFMCSKLRIADDVCLREIASFTPGYVGADLLSLIRESALSAVYRVMDQVPRIRESQSNSENSGTSTEAEETKSANPIESSSHTSLSNKLKQSLLWMRNKLPIKEEYLENVCISKEDFKLSLKRVQPSSKREGFATVPDVTWDDVGSLKDIREVLQMAILAPVKYPKHFAELGLPASMGVLLCGPPGCGKTLLAKAVANEAGINFISVKGPELLNMYVGGSEKAVRECFQRAKNSQPCVIFFDELDALCPKRSDHSENSAGMRVVNQLLTEMDGVEGRTGVFLMAATNRPDIIDPAVLRPGRLDKILYVGFPNEVDRIDILRALTKNGSKPPLDEDVSLDDVAKNPVCEGFTGADLAALVRDASMLALSEIILSAKSDNDFTPVFVTTKHFNNALQNLRPSVSEKDRKHYEQLRIKFATSAYQMQKKDD